MVIMAVDLGKARTGIAICDKTELLASPLTQINEYNREKLLDKISDLAKEKRAELLVVGLPKNMDGSLGFRADITMKFADDLKKRLPETEFIFQDERLTTVQASTFLNATNTRGKSRKNVIDTVAAEIILQSYLDSIK